MIGPIAVLLVVVLWQSRPCSAGADIVTGEAEIA